MNFTNRNHYNPCFWTAFWNRDYYEMTFKGIKSKKPARDHVVHSLNIKSQKICPMAVNNVHYDKNLGVAEISKAAAENFVLRNYPEQYDNFIIENKDTSDPVYFDFEDILTGLEATSGYQILLEVIPKQMINNLVEKCYLASFIVLQNVRSHSMMKSMIEWHKEIGQEKFECFVLIKSLLGDPHFMYGLVNRLVNSKWNFYTSNDYCFPLCDCPILVQPKSVMVALSPKLLLEICTDTPTPEEMLPNAQKITESKLEEYRLRTIGNTFREIIGEPQQLENWKVSTEFQRRSELMKDVKQYNSMVEAKGNQELWNLNAYANRL